MSYGNLHYDITINFREEINFNTDKEVRKEANHLIRFLVKNTQLLTFLVIVPELNEKKKIHFRLFLAIRTFIGTNHYLRKNIEWILWRKYGLNVEVKKLNTRAKRKDSLKSFFKDLPYTIKYLTIRYIINSQFILADLIRYVNTVCRVGASIRILSEGFKKASKKKLNKDIALDAMDNTLKGIIVRKEDEEIKETTVIYLWIYFLILNKLFIYQGYLYIKEDSMLISFKKYKPLKFLYENFDEVYSFFLNRYPIHFGRFNVISLKREALLKSEEKLKKLEYLTISKLKPDFNLLEFKDGIYYMNTGKFVSKRSLKNDNLSGMVTIKYYNKVYKYIEEPVEWLNNLKLALNQNAAELDDLCCYIASIFHKNNDLITKKKVLYIVDESTTKRAASLITTPLLLFFEVKNIYFLSGRSVVDWRNLDDKMLILFDEFNYEEYSKDDLMELFDGNIELIFIKSQEDGVIELPPVIMISNKKIHESDETIKQIIDDKIRVFILTTMLGSINISENIDGKLKNDGINILLYCNEVFFKRISSSKIINKNI
jgi:hypothetical protein